MRTLQRALYPALLALALLWPVAPTGARTVAGGPLFCGLPAATPSAVIPPVFAMVCETVSSTPTCTPAGATALALSEAGTASTTRNTPPAVLPLP